MILRNLRIVWSDFQFYVFTRCPPCKSAHTCHLPIVGGPNPARIVRPICARVMHSTRCNSTATVARSLTGQRHSCSRSDWKNVERIDRCATLEMHDDIRANDIEKDAWNADWSDWIACAHCTSMLKASATCCSASACLLAGSLACLHTAPSSTYGLPRRNQWRIGLAQIERRKWIL